MNINNKKVLLDCTLRDGGYYTDWYFSSEFLDNYLNQAIQFSHLRKLDIHNLYEIKYGEFTYDFVKASESGYQVNPNQIVVNNRRVNLLFQRRI